MQRGAIAPLPLSRATQAARSGSTARNTQAAVESHSTTHLERNREPRSAARGGPWLSAGAIRRFVRLAPCRSVCRIAIRPARLLSLDLHGLDRGPVSHDWISRTCSRLAGRALYQYSAVRHLGDGDPFSLAWTTVHDPPSLRPTASTTGRSHVACTGQPLCFSIGLPSGSVGCFSRRGVHTLCRRSGVLGRSRLCPSRPPVSAPCRGHRPGRRLRGATSKNAHHATRRTPTTGRYRRQRKYERTPRRLRTAEGHVDELRAARTGEPKPHGARRSTGPPAGAHLVRRNVQFESWCAIAPHL